MKKHIYILTTITTSVLLSFCGNNNTPNKSASGKEIYERTCSVCHGLDGKGNISGAAYLYKSKLTINACIEVIKNGKGNMPGNLLTNESDINAVAEYIQTLRTE